MNQNINKKIFFQIILHQKELVSFSIIFQPSVEDKWKTLGNLRSYDGNFNENVTLKLNFALS